MYNQIPCSFRLNNITYNETKDKQINLEPKYYLWLNKTKSDRSERKQRQN